MKFSKKVNYSLFGFLILINILLRYPLTPHEIGADSFQIHSYANSISGFGYATWIIHPYSYLGLTPDSYPSAVPFLLSALSQCMDVDMEFTVLLLSFFVGLLGLFGSIILAKKIKNDDIFILLVAFLYSTAPIFLRFTIWTTSTRHLFMGMFPIFLWVLLKIQDFSEIKWKYLGLAIIFFIMLISTHRMGLLLFLVIIALIITILISRYEKYFEFNTLIQKAGIFIFILVFIFFILLQVMDIGIYSEINISHEYKSGQFFSGNAPFSILMNMLVDYTSRTGILSIFGIMGVSIIFIKRNKPNSVVKQKRNFNELFFIINLLVSSSILLLGIYISLYLLPVLILLICLGILWSLQLIRKIKWKINQNVRSVIVLIFIIFLLFISSIFSIFMIYHWSKPISITQESAWVEDETIDVAFYLNNFKDEKIISLSNSELIKTRLVAWRNEPVDYRIDLEYVNIKKSSFLDLIRHDTLYIKTETENERLNIPLTDCNDKNTINYLNRNNIKFFIEKKSISGKIVLYGYSGLQDSIFLSTMHDKRYRLYDNNLETIWYI